MPDGAGFAFAQGILAVTGEKIYFLPPGTKPHSMNIAFVRIQPTGTTKTTSMLKRTFFITAPVAALLLLASCSGGDHAKTDEMMAHNKAMMAADSLTKAQEATTKALYDLINTTSSDGIEKLVTDDFVDHQMDTSIKSTGIQALKDEMAMYFTAFPDFHQDIMGMATNGDRTYVVLHITGTNKGPWGSTMPATGKAIDVMGADVVRFVDGKVAEHWGYMEEMKMMGQLGLWPPAPAAAPKSMKK
jgi:predicted ester cyclase